MNKIKYAVILLAINYASSVIADSKLSEIVVSPSQRTTTIFDSLSSVRPTPIVYNNKHSKIWMW